MDYLINIFVFILIFSIVVQSLNFILGSLGIVSMCHAIFFGIGAYTSALMSIHVGGNFFLGALAGFAIAFVVGCLLAAPSLRVQDEYLIVFTVGFQMVMFEFFLTARNITRGQGGIPDIPPVSLFGWSFDSSLSFLLFLLVVTIIIFALSRRLFFSPFGRALKAIREDESAARSLGKNSLVFKVIMFGLSGGIAAIGGSLLAHYVSYITPTNFSVEISISLLVMVILGGMGNFWGPLVGSAVLVGLPELLRFIPGSGGLIDATREILYGVILMLAMIYRPQGILPEHPMIIRKKLREEARPDKSEAGGGHWEEKGRQPRGNRKGSPIMEVRGISKSFGGLQAVDDVYLSLPEGEITGLIGPNGCGKTTLFNLICGHIPPDKGSIHLDEREYSKTPAYRLPGYGVVRSWQDVRIFQNMTVLENVMVAGPNQTGENPFLLFVMAGKVGREERENRRRAERYLELVGLSQMTDQLVKNLSAADQKLLAFARLLATECPVLLLDEPTAALDLESVERIKKLIKILVNQEKKTILLVEHNLDIVKDLVDKAYFMSDGKILAYETPEELMRDRKLTEVYFGTD